MTFDVETKDCTALSDAELADMADIVADGPAGFDIGLLSKQRDEWVLITQVRDEGRLLGFSFCTLERIGGTPCVLWGLVSVKRCAEREAVLDALRADQFRKAVLAFPDEDVLVATRFLSPAASPPSTAWRTSAPGPATRSRARSGPGPGGWPSASGPRAGSTTAASSSSGDGSPCPVFDYEPEDLTTSTPMWPSSWAPGRRRRDVLIAFGWAMSEELATASSPEPPGAQAVPGRAGVSGGGRALRRPCGSGRRPAAGERPRRGARAGRRSWCCRPGTERRPGGGRCRPGPAGARPRGSGTRAPRARPSRPAGLRLGQGHRRVVGAALPERDGGAVEPEQRGVLGVQQRPDEALRRPAGQAAGRLEGRRR